jgi:hypothetical protein
MTENILSLLLNAYYQLDNELQISLEKKGLAAIYPCPINDFSKYG